MHRRKLLNLLRAYQTTDPEEQMMLAKTIHFVENQPRCFERTLEIGHVTGSAWIVSPDRKRAVLLHHTKLDRWLQPGGHADGDPDVLRVAFREAEEETGLASLKVISSAIFDLDVHPIPARGNEPEHLHYDIRFLLEADPFEPFVQTPEAKEVRWFTFDEIAKLTSEKSVLRMMDKEKANNY
ncbi:NUDIX hydrolase [Larkinella sp. VNQ87]|uniref:NUDIX hydrolase n=1 Tax=Larkinella sp. VNQ87 TaxID=3400921 RepID=UPI003C10C9B9